MPLATGLGLSLKEPHPKPGPGHLFTTFNLELPDITKPQKNLGCAQTLQSMDRTSQKPTRGKGRNRNTEMRTRFGHASTRHRIQDSMACPIRPSRASEAGSEHNWKHEETHTNLCPQLRPISSREPLMMNSLMCFYD